MDPGCMGPLDSLLASYITWGPENQLCGDVDLMNSGSIFLNIENLLRASFSLSTVITRLSIDALSLGGLS